MIYIDSRIGSKELEPLFRPFGVSVQLAELEFADLCWVGNGPDGECMVGVERKRINDLIQSIRSKRLSGHQLPGMMQSYQYVYLQVEGFYRPGRKGALEVMKGKDWWPSDARVMYREIDNYLNTLEAKCGVIVHRAGTIEEGIHQIVDLYKWWTEKTWAEHKSDNQLYAPTPQGRKVGWHYEPPTWLEKIAAQLPGVDRKAKAVAKHFGSVEMMVDAGIGDWMMIDGIGKIGAVKIMKALREKQ
ncbi:MAG TPA: ERCC4 domain-containing protein [Nitrospiraceae bacterium]